MEATRVAAQLAGHGCLYARVSFHAVCAAGACIYIYIYAPWCRYNTAAHMYCLVLLPMLDEGSGAMLTGQLAGGVGGWRVCVEGGEEKVLIVMLITGLYRST